MKCRQSATRLSKKTEIQPIIVTTVQFSGQLKALINCVDHELEMVISYLLNYERCDDRSSMRDQKSAVWWTQKRNYKQKRTHARTQACTHSKHIISNNYRITLFYIVSIDVKYNEKKTKSPCTEIGRSVNGQCYIVKSFGSVHEHDFGMLLFFLLQMEAILRKICDFISV